MHPVLGILASIGVLVGMHISWKIGWHLDDWVRKIFPYRVSTNDTHVVLGPTIPATPAEVEQYRLGKMMGGAWMTHNEIRDMKWGVEKAIESNCKACETVSEYKDEVKHLTYLNGAEKVHHLNNEQVDAFLGVMEEGVKNATTQAEVDEIRKDLIDLKIVYEGRELELKNLVQNFKNYRVENI